MSKEAMKLALGVLSGSWRTEEEKNALREKQIQAVIALREALAKPDFWEGYVPEPVKPAEQEPKIDIYRSFEQWKSGNVLEHGVPRTEFYTKADLNLVEMGWNYGYDAGRAVEQALDKKAENARELGLDYEPAQQEPVAHAVIAGALFDFMGWLTSRKERLVLSSADNASPAVEAITEFAKMRGLSLNDAKVQDWNTSPPAQQEPVAWMDIDEKGAFSGLRYWSEPDNRHEVALYTFPPAQQEPVALKWQQAPVKTQWGDDMVVASVAIDNDHTLSLYCERDQAPKVDAMFAQRTWVGLTDEEREIASWADGSFGAGARWADAKLKEKNT